MPPMMASSSKTFLKQDMDDPSSVGEYVRGCVDLCAAEGGAATYRRIPFTVHPQGKILSPSRGVEDAALYTFLVVNLPPICRGRIQAARQP